MDSREFVEFEGLEVREVGYGRWDLGREIGVGDVVHDGEGYDTVRFAVALDGVPIAAISVGVPGGKEVGVVEVLFELEEGFLVFWVAENGKSRGD